MVAILEAKIKEKEPIVKVNAENCKVQQEKIAIEKEAADVQGKQVGVEKAAADVEKAKVEKQAAEIDATVRDAERKLASAFETIKKVDENDIKELFKYKSPSPKMMPLLGIFLEIWDTKEQSENGKKLVYEMEEIEENGKKKKQKSVFKTSVRINGSCKLKNEMLEFPKDKLKNFVDVMWRLDEEFKGIDREEMGKISKALLAIYEFVGVMTTFFKLDLTLEPARKDLAEAKSNLATLIAKVDQLSKNYKELVDKVEALERDLQVEIDKLKVLEDDLEKMTRQKIVAVKLTDGLKGEKQSWLQAAEVYKKLVVNVEGDVLVSCAVQAYLGAFVLNYRQNEVKKWVGWIKDRHIALSEGVSLEATLGDPIKVQEWFKAELPTDPFTVENTVIMNLTDKFTLAIDPQNQCNSFLKKYATEVLERKLKIFNAVTSTPDRDMKDLKRAISLGMIVLIENIQETINPALEPLLNKLIVKKGSMKIINIENEDID